MGHFQLGAAFMFFSAHVQKPDTRAHDVKAVARI